MDDADEPTPMEVVDPEMRRLLGMFDVPAFARRGQDVEMGLRRLRARLDERREELLAMVRLRLRQWSAAVGGPEAWTSAFAAPIAELWALAGAEAPESWGTLAASPRRRRAIARDLAASVARFNRRWDRHLRELNLEPLNVLIDHYNRYYLLEKECAFRSARLATRHFDPKPRITVEALLAEYPPLPVPQPLD